MGTFGTGAFSSDGALDFLEELAERPAERRAAALEHMFRFVRDKPELLWREFFPDQVVAAAAIVAATLPGGQQFGERLVELADDDIVPDVRLAAPVPELAKAALEVLLFVAGPEGPWHRGWTNESDAAEARNTIDTLSLVLSEAGRRM